MSDSRRGRPTIRCLVEDLGIELPDLTVDLGEMDAPWVAEVRRIAPTAPEGQKRILSIDHPMIYRLRLSTARGATWLDEDEVVWLCAVRRREEGSDDDAFAWFAALHQAGRLLPTDDDRLRDQSEQALRTFRRLRDGLFRAVGDARDCPGAEQEVDLDGWLPCRVLVLPSDGVEEIWCAISVLAADGRHIRHEIRDLLFAALEDHLAPAVFEARSDWPAGEVQWYEAVRLGMR